MNPTSKTDPPQGRAPRFVKMPRALLERRDLPLGARVLLADLTDRTGQNGHAWPGIRRLAADLGTDPKAVLRWLAALERAGLVSVTRRGTGRSNTYQLQTVGESPALANDQRGLFANGGVGESPTEALAFSQHNKTDQLKRPKVRSAPAARTPRPADPVWDAVCDLFNLKPVTKADKARVGRVVRDLKQKGATPDELRNRIGRYKAAWPAVECTPESLCKHWQRFAADATGPGADRGGDRIRAPAGKYAGLAKTVKGDLPG